MQFSFLERRGDPARGAGVSGVPGVWPVGPMIVLLVGLLAALPACSDPSPRVTKGVHEAPPQGVPVVENVESSARVEEWRAQEQLRVGAADGEAAFGRVADVAPRAAGGLWVLDAQSNVVSGFTEDGSVAVRFGGEGDGPGELRTPSKVFEVPGGTILVGSAFPPALHRFDSDGNFLGSSRLTESRDREGNPLPARFAEWQSGPAGRAVANLFAVPGPGQGSRTAHVLVAFADEDLDRSVRDTIVQWSVPATPASPSSPIDIVPVRPSWSAGPGDLIWWSPGTPYELRGYDAKGTPVRIITLDREPIRVTREIEEALIRDLRASAAAGPGGSAVVERALERARWPKSLPHVADLWVSHPGGQLFVLTWAADSYDATAPRRLDVFEKGGRYAAQLTLPSRFSPRRFADGAVYGVERDELGVDYAVRYAIGPVE